jgi:hypothetical protein
MNFGNKEEEPEPGNFEGIVNDEEGSFNNSVFYLKPAPRKRRPTLPVATFAGVQDDQSSSLSSFRQNNNSQHYVSSESDSQIRHDTSVSGDQYMDYDIYEGLEYGSTSSSHHTSATSSLSSNSVNNLGAIQGMPWSHN